MSFEEKHQYFKKAAQRSNWKNPLQTLAYRHEKNQAILYTTLPGKRPPNIFGEEKAFGKKKDLEGGDHVLANQIIHLEANAGNPVPVLNEFFK